MENKYKLYDHLKSSFLIKEDPLQQLINNFEDIKNYIYSNYEENKRIFYFSRDKIHQILYEEDEIFNFDNENEEKLIKIPDNLSELFYLSILVLYSADYDYNYPKKNIDLIYKYARENENEEKPYLNIIIWKIIYSLNENYKESEEVIENEYNKIIDECNKIFKKYIDLFKKKLNLETKESYFKDKKIDEIYSEIINSLIINQKFQDYKFCLDIIMQLNIEKIEITKTIFDGLSKTLEKEEYNKYYVINDEKDLINETKINFYYILIKFILKNIFYIYNIPFLYSNFLKFKKFIKRIKMNDNSENILKNDKLKIILQLFDLEKDTIKKIENINTENSSQGVSFFSKIQSSIQREREENDNGRYFDEEQSMSNLNIPDNDVKPINVNEAKEILKKLEFEMIKMNDTYIDYRNIVYSQNTKLGNIDELNKKFNYLDMEYKDKDEKKIYKNYQKLINFLEEIEEYIKQSKITISEQAIKIKLIKLEEEEKKCNNNRGNNKDKYKDIFNIVCTSSFVYNKNNIYRNYEFKDEDILVNGLDSKSQGFIYLINELSNEDYSIIENQFENKIII